MTTISPNRRRKNLPTTFLKVAVLLLLVLVVVLFRAQLTGLFLYVAEPLVSLRNSLDSTENARLRAELASTTALIADRGALLEENRQLKFILGRTVQKRTVLAAVLMRPPGTPYDTLLIDAGFKEGVVMGSKVYANGNTLIGTISEVYNSSARVLLLSSPGENYQALLRATLPIAVVGEGAGSFSSEVPAGTEVHVGDSVTFPGIAGGFIGSVSHIAYTGGESFETIYLQLPVSLFALRFVEVELP